MLCWARTDVCLKDLRVAAAFAFEMLHTNLHDVKCNARNVCNKSKNP